jgi:hypothetical protein
MYGAVQGVATKVVNTPVKNEARKLALSESVADARKPTANFEYPRQIQAHCQQQVHEQGDEQRRLQLESPAHLFAAGTKRQQRPRQA